MTSEWKIVEEEVLCVMWNGRCNSDYLDEKIDGRLCNGKDIPSWCPYKGQ